MAHYAFLDENNIVTEVITGVDETELIEGLHPEIWYGNFRGQVCKQTSYNTRGNNHKNCGTPFRKNFAGIGSVYNQDLDAFIGPSPFPSWILDEETCLWEPPIAKPEYEPGNFWIWNETNQTWDRSN
jgi:hypothetical protein